MEKLILKKPDESYAAQIIEYKAEFIAAGSSMDGCSSLRKTDDPFRFIQNCRDYSKKETVPAPLVPADLYFLIRPEDDRLLGMVDIRHYLNDHLLKCGGHIGYSIRPTERRKGYSKDILRLALEKCAELGIGRVLVTCNDGNIASEKTIISCGGVFENALPDSDGALVKLVWVEL